MVDLSVVNDDSAEWRADEEADGAVVVVAVVVAIVVLELVGVPGAGSAPVLAELCLKSENEPWEPPSLPFDKLDLGDVTLVPDRWSGWCCNSSEVRVAAAFISTSPSPSTSTPSASWVSVRLRD